MNLRRLPPSMLLVLGLGCPATEEPLPGDGTADSGSSTGGSQTSSTTNGSTTNGNTTNGSASATSTTGRTTGITSCLADSGCLDVGPCLVDIGNIPDMGNSSETGTGPCLLPPLDTGPESSSGSDSGTDTGSGSETGTGTGTTGDMLDQPPSDTRAAAVQRVLSRGVLPDDVATRLSNVRSARSKR